MNFCWSVLSNIYFSHGGSFNTNQQEGHKNNTWKFTAYIGKVKNGLEQHIVILWSLDEKMLT